MSPVVGVRNQRREAGQEVASQLYRQQDPASDRLSVTLVGCNRAISYLQAAAAIAPYAFGCNAAKTTRQVELTVEASTSGGCGTVLLDATCSA